MYGAVVERLPWYSVTPSSKAFRRVNRKVKSGHPPDTCPFFEEMEALMSAQVISLPINDLEEAASHSAQGGSDAETEEPGQKDRQHEDGEEAVAGRLDSDDLEATPQDPDSPPASILF